MDYALMMSAYERRARASASRRLTQQDLLYESLRRAILDGDIVCGTRLASSRTLAEELGIARNSVLYAYERLVEEGFVTATRHGSIVNHVKPAAAQPAARAEPREDTARLLSRRVRELPPRRASGDAATALRPGTPALDAFPLAQWRTALERAMREVDASELGYGDSAGLPALRHAIAQYVRVSRGVRCRPDQVFITDGTQTSLDLCARFFADAGERVWIENPGYMGARVNMQAAGLTLVPVPVDAAGMAAREEDWREAPPRLVYLTPSHQYPLGCVLSLERRLALIEHARACGAWIIEDDYDSELRHDGPPLPSIQGLADDTPVIYLGTFSKTLFPALRIGFMIVPRQVVAQVATAHRTLMRQGRVAEQAALADFIESGRYARHLRRMRKLYETRRDGLVAAIEKHLAGLITVSADAGGMHLSVRLDAPLTDVAVSEAARSHGLALSPLSAFCLDGPDGREPVRYNGFLLGYAEATPEASDALMATLAGVLRAML
ncbi:PLP-dependent aminotransferase family protein [Paraburkholderia silviterrae]|uniref:PLP-dependent aminotransferase family protein n=1 Tax=Paraburkholderia silviterrae TaxID=2528715 RepID=A0A4R5M7S2_9BURK|nr:PLP-dependent aminotransferase family protein [Paraburkholderia silviterrae]TDG21591.1 PLP-dependent aminotransferase family protein [Paraburkholderia silviterrae]